MGDQGAGWSRREFVGGLTLAGTAGFLEVRPVKAAAEPPPETTRIRFQNAPAACLAPQYIAEELLKAEGFTDVQFVNIPEGGPALNKALVSGEAHFALNDAPNNVMGVASGVSIVVLGGVHAGCYELFGTDRVRSISDLKGKAVAVPGLRSGRHVFVATIAASVGLDPTRDITWVVRPEGELMRLFAEGKVDAFLGFPPEPQELRAKKIGRVIVNTLTDRPWSQYFCCMVAASREFVQRSLVATKRVLRAILKSADICSLEPERVARLVVDRGFVQRPPGVQRDRLPAVAPVRSGADNSFLRTPPARGGIDQVHPAEDHRPGHRLALPQRAEEGTEG